MNKRNMGGRGKREGKWGRKENKKGGGGKYGGRRIRYKREKVFYFVPSARLGSTQCSIGEGEEVVFRDASSVVRGDEWTSFSCSPFPSGG